MRAPALGALLVLVATTAAAAPSWWRVAQDRSEVWILGVPAVTPRGMVWDQQVVRQRLHGANELIVAPRARGGLRALGGLIGTAGALRSPTPMEDGLAAPLRRRLVTIRMSLGKDAGHYAGWKPTVAGALLQGDFLKANDLKVGEIEASVRKLAHDAGVREAPAGAYDSGPMIAAAGALGPAGQSACLASQLQSVEAGAGSMRATAQAWSRGVVKATAVNPVDQACLAAFPMIKVMSERNVDEESHAIALALAHPGHSVAVFDLVTLTLAGGVLDHLRGRRLVVTGPQP
ncbi:MAG TPA: TraB/GumN family protein [Caulobacteraceae bacterium]